MGVSQLQNSIKKLEHMQFALYILVCYICLGSKLAHPKSELAKISKLACFKIQIVEYCIRIV